MIVNVQWMEDGQLGQSGQHVSQCVGWGTATGRDPVVVLPRKMGAISVLDPPTKIIIVLVQIVPKQVLLLYNTCIQYDMTVFSY